MNTVLKTLLIIELAAVGVVPSSLAQIKHQSGFAGCASSLLVRTQIKKSAHVGGGELFSAGDVRSLVERDPTYSTHSESMRELAMYLILSLDRVMYFKGSGLEYFIRNVMVSSPIRPEDKDRLLEDILDSQWGEQFHQHQKAIPQVRLELTRLALRILGFASKTPTVSHKRVLTKILKYYWANDDVFVAVSNLFLLYSDLAQDLSLVSDYLRAAKLHDMTYPNKPPRKSFINEMSRRSEFLKMTLDQLGPRRPL